MVLFEVLKAVLMLAVEVVKSTQHCNEFLVFESLFEAVDVLLIQVSDGVGNEDNQLELRVFLEVDVHVKHYLSHLTLREDYHVDSLDKDVFEDAALLGLELVSYLPKEGLEFHLLVLAELYGEDLVADAVLVLVVALPNNVIHGRVQILMDQLFLDPLTGPQLFAEPTRPPEAVALAPDVHKLLFLLSLHLELNLNEYYTNSAPDIDRRGMINRAINHLLSGGC